MVTTEASRARTAQADTTAPIVAHGSAGVAGTESRPSAAHIPARFSPATISPRTAPTATTISDSAPTSRNTCPWVAPASRRLSLSSPPGGPTLLRVEMPCEWTEHFA